MIVNMTFPDTIHGGAANLMYFFGSMYPSRPSSHVPSRGPSRGVSRRNSANSHVSSATWRSALKSARIQHSGLRKLRAAALGMNTKTQISNQN